MIGAGAEYVARELRGLAAEMREAAASGAPVEVSASGLLDLAQAMERGARMLGPNPFAESAPIEPPHYGGTVVVDFAAWRARNVEGRA